MRRIVPIVLVVAGFAGLLHAGLRKPDAAEAKAISKIAGAIAAVFDTFEKADWQKTGDFYDGDPQVNTSPSTPLDINQNFERDYTVRENSERARKLIMPLAAKIEQTTDIPTKLKLGEQYSGLLQLKVYAYVNRQGFEIHPPPPGNHPISVPGAAFAYKVDPSANDYCEPHGACYLLGFGDWKSASWQGSNVSYRFKHPVKSPYVENVFIRLTGADDRIQELLRITDWNLINQGLTR